jgi:hypothetical protein
MSSSTPEAPFNPWAGAAQLLSGSVRALPHQGDVTVADGWKVARLVAPVPGTFAGLAFGEYPVTAVAVCSRERSHLPPVTGCECGFHVLERREQAAALLDRARGLVLLHVELYGNIVVHRDGMRGEEQDVHAVYLQSRCARIGCRGVTVGVAPARRRWWQSCTRHLGTGLGLDELREVLRIDVALLER